MKKTKMNNGITLIVLAITIIVILILATVVISKITDDNIIGQTDEAVLKKYEADAKEHVSIAWTFVEDLYGENVATVEKKEEYFSEERLNEYIDQKEGIILYSDGERYVVYSSYTSKRTYIFEIKDDGEVEKLADTKTKDMVYGKASQIIKPENYGDKMLYASNGEYDYKHLLNEDAS